MSLKRSDFIFAIPVHSLVPISVANEIANVNNSLKFFPDYTRVLHEFNGKGQSWVATENCAITGTVSQLTRDAGGGQIFVDGALVAVSYISKPDIQIGTTVFALVKKGQTITTRREYGAYSVKAYGLY